VKRWYSLQFSGTISFRSSATVVFFLIPKFSTSTFSTPGETKAGRRGPAALCVCDHGGEVLFAVFRGGNVGDPGEADRSGGVDAVFVRVFRRDQAVRRDEHRAVEGLELLLLEGPRSAVVPDQVPILLERRVGMRREHLAMSVDIHAGALRLFEEEFKIFEVMAGDQDAGPCARGGADRGDLRGANRSRCSPCRGALDCRDCVL